MLITCAIRDNAERRIWQRLEELRAWKRKNGLSFRVGLLGCMAGAHASDNHVSAVAAAKEAFLNLGSLHRWSVERLKTKLLEEDQLVDLVAGPDAYRDLPRMLAATEDGQAQVRSKSGRGNVFGLSG